eukprot:107651_1
MSKVKQRAQEDQKRYDEEHNALMDDDFEWSTKKRIDWDSIPDDYISNNDRLNLRQLQGSENELLAPHADIAAIFDDEEQSISVAQSFIRVLELRSPDHLTYILLLLSSILRNDDRRGKIFLKLQERTNQRVIDCFSRVWLRDDISAFCHGKAAISAAIILRWSTDHKAEAEYRSLCSFILREFKVSKNDQLISPLLALKGVIRNEYFQNIFFNEGGIDKLHHIIFANENHRQVIYLTVYSLWALTFNPSNIVLKTALVKGQLIDKLVKFIKAKSSMKITRVVLGLFDNLIGFENFNEMVVLFGLFPVLEQLESEEKKIDDEELNKSVKNLLNNLEKSVRILSSFERYQQEIRSGKLMWGPCHNESFWKKYSNKLEDDNFKLLRCLVDLLDSPDDPETVAVACYDIGEWSRFYQEGSAKSVIEKLNGKYKMMKLIDHHDNEVKQNALNAVQKVLVKNWKAETAEQNKS